MFLRTYLRSIKNYFIKLTKLKPYTFSKSNTKLLSIRVIPCCFLLCIAASLLYILVYHLYNELYCREIVDKHSDQCSAYPNKLLKIITANQTYEQIEDSLKKFNIRKGGIFITQNKGNLNLLINLKFFLFKSKLNFTKVVVNILYKNC